MALIQILLAIILLYKMDKNYQHFVLDIIVKYKIFVDIVNSVEESFWFDSSLCVMLFKPCIKNFSYFNMIVQIDETFLKKKIMWNLYRQLLYETKENMFSLTFAIIQGETKEAYMLFFYCYRILKT